MSEPIVITLKTPVQAFGEEITELKLRRPKGKDFRAITSTTPMGMTLDLAGALADVPPSTIDQLDGEDVMKLAQAVAPFFS
ncbi:MAG: phage tail assembly protein [Methylococcaceae bacterium]|nr:phage tail assembly protein [Methylococcaceae bacterium]